MKPSNFYIILCHPFTADNIGAAARAMKNMGFSNLRLVAPRRNWKKRAYVLARNASEVVEHARVFATLGEATADLNWTCGTTRRVRGKAAKFLAFESFIDVAGKKSRGLKVGLVFGRESKGLNAEELEHCDQLVSLPADEAYPSLNLAQAVMVTLFSLSRKRLSGAKTVVSMHAEKPLLDKSGVQSAMQSFAKALECIGFYGGKDGRLDKIMKVTEAIFKRAGMFDYEAQMLKGVSARIIERTAQKK